MSRRTRQTGRMAMSLAALVISVWFGTGSALAIPRQVGHVAFTSEIPGTATGLVIRVRFQNPSNRAEKPYSVATMAIHGPRGGVINTNVPPQCSQLQGDLLLVEGPSACPAGSKVGGGTVVSDTGGGGLFPRYQHLVVSDFNTHDGIIGFDQDKNPPYIRAVDHTTFSGTTSTTDFPDFPGSPPPDNYSAVKTLDLFFPAYTRNGRAYHLTPPRCPAQGYWTFTARFTYHDGVTQSITSRSPCRKK